jgi:hypothetical protein
MIHSNKLQHTGKHSRIHVHGIEMSPETRGRQEDLNPRASPQQSHPSVLLCEQMEDKGSEVGESQ